MYCNPMRFSKTERGFCSYRENRPACWTEALNCVMRMHQGRGSRTFAVAARLESERSDSRTKGLNDPCVCLTGAKKNMIICLKLSACES